MSVLYPKGGNIVWNCVKNNIIKEQEYYKYIGLRGFDYKLFEEEDGGGVRGYLNHIIQLWSGGWVKQIEKMNEMVGMKNFILMSGINRWLRLVRHFTRQKFWKCIGCIISAVTYGMKVHKIWS